jgi:hypothetical protein
MEEAMGSIELTVAVLSCKRLELLERTLAAIRPHFERVEPDVRVTWTCFDNGSSPAERQALEGMGFDLLLLSRENLGQGPALNLLLGAVRTPLFLLLEDDWALENPADVRFVEESHAILQADPSLGTVKLDAMHFIDFDDRTRYAGPFQVPGRGVKFHVQNPTGPWGGLCFSPAITRTDAVRRVGAIREDEPFRKWWAESEYTTRFASELHAVKSPDMLLFKHLGDAPCPDWVVPQLRGVAP